MSNKPVVIDDENPEWTKEDFARARPASEMPVEMRAAFKNVGRPKKDDPKQAVSIRLSQDVLDYFRSTGPGWQTRIDEILRRAIGARK